MSNHDFGMVGLGTMGRALLLNMADHGFSVVGFDTDESKVASLDAAHPNATGTTSLTAFVQSIRRPRAIMMLVPAGAPVDQVIESLKPLLEPGDFLIDGGNSFFRDTERRVAQLKDAGFGFTGMGISGGEAGARNGPSMMPGGTPENYERIRPILEAIAARAEDGTPCVARVGLGAAGHYVKTVHNGIEYAMMQLIAESYDLLHRGYGFSNELIADVFEDWSKSPMGGYLLEITHRALRAKDPESGRDLVDLVKDKAKAKGTGKWTSQDAMDLGLPVPAIDAAVTARGISNLKELRERYSEGNEPRSGSIGHDGLNPNLIAKLQDALHASFLLAYLQGLHQILEGSQEYGFECDLPVVIRCWRAGCIIRSQLLSTLAEAAAKSPQEPLVLHPSIRDTLEALGGHLSEVVTQFALSRVPAPCHMASLAYLDGIRSRVTSANLIQAQRDTFGAHGYERIDKPGTFHGGWD